MLDVLVALLVLFGTPPKTQPPTQSVVVEQLGQTTQQVHDIVEQVQDIVMGVVRQVVDLAVKKPNPYFKSHDPQPLLKVMHGARWDLPRLWTRGGFIEISAAVMADECNARLQDEKLIYNSHHGDMHAKKELKRWRELYARLITEIGKTKLQCINENDLVSLRAWVTGDGFELVIMLTPDDGYAHVSGDGSVHIPHVPWLPTGWPGRSVVYHEMTHYMQIKFCPFENKTCDLNQWQATYELAAMIVESAEMVREGMTDQDWVNLDQSKWIIATLYPRYRDFEAVVPPRMGGALFREYLLKYGPQFTGSMIPDLFELERWTKSFENLGPYVPVQSEIIDPDWMSQIQKNVQGGLLSSLASTCQTYLAVNRCPSGYPVQGAVPNDTPSHDISVKEFIAIREAANPSDPNELAAIAFLKRCNK